ncbi:hypothetical protein [Muricoccus nepalensis]|uniref:hypothetical protein n=1 Tax=Muricoccus nepalensis TaxID=1854500 RepID=UPI00112BD975|nr:hypothetical protein [Roseomonas nepalensis]
MSLIGTVNVRMAAEAKFLPASVLRILRVLRDAGLIPKGEVGGAQHNSHFDCGHLAYVLLSFAAHQLSDAALTAAALGSMRMFASAPGGEPREPGQCLHDAVAQAVDDAGRWTLAHKGSTELLVWPERVPLTIELSMDMPQSGKVVWREDRYDYYIPQGFGADVGGVVRKTYLDRRMIMAAGDLWADTLSRRGSLPLPPTSTPAVSEVKDGNGVFPTEGGPQGTKSETENGANGALPGATEAPSNHDVQPRTNGTSCSHSCEFRETESEPQVRSRPRLGISTQSFASRPRRLGEQSYAIPFA